MDERLLKIWTEGEVVETFPYDDEELQPGHFESIIVHDEVVYHILLSPDQQPVRINHIASEADYDIPGDDEGDEWRDWDNTLMDGLEDDTYDFTDEEE